MEVKPYHRPLSLNSKTDLVLNLPSTKSPSLILLLDRRISCSSISPSNQSNKFSTPVSILRIIPDWADEIKERGMKKKRKLYDHDAWVEHRSSLRHVRHVLSSFSSRVIVSLIPPVFAFTTFAMAIAIYNSAVEMRILPHIFPLLRGSSLPFQLTAPALALLLVFRTEASYSRYEEGRKAWTKIIYRTNELANLVISGVDYPSDCAIKSSLLDYITAFPVALKCHLTFGSDLAQELRGLLTKDDVAVVMKSKHPPRCIVGLISRCFKLLKVDESKRNLLQSRVSCFHEGIAVCEQLQGVPIPLSYTRLTSRFLVLWHIGLPIILWDDCHWIVVPATFISAASLFCIEEVGVLIEEPFPMLALDELCLLVRNNVEEALAMEVAIKDQLADKLKHSAEHVSNGCPKL